MKEGKWVCQSCGKDWGDGQELIGNKDQPPLPIRKDISMICLSENGCADGEVKWVPSPAPSELLDQGYTATGHTVHVPNDLTRRTMDETDRGEDLTVHESVESLMDDLTDTQELKPCPFCGAEAVFSKPGDSGTDVQIYCEICTNAETNYYLSKAEAIAAWNRRPIEDELRAEVVRLNEELHDPLGRIAEKDDEIAKLKGECYHAIQLRNVLQSKNNGLALSLATAQAENERLRRGQRETNDKLKEAYTDLTAAQERIKRYEEMERRVREWQKKGYATVSGPTYLYILAALGQAKAEPKE